MRSKTMRITERYRDLSRVSKTDGVRPIEKTDNASEAGAAKGTARGNSLEINVSERAQELARGAARLEELRASVRNGTFKIDPHAIAARLVGEKDE